MKSRCPNSNADDFPCRLWKPKKVQKIKTPAIVTGHYLAYVDALLVSCPTHESDKWFSLIHDEIEWSEDNDEFPIILDDDTNEPQNWRLYAIRKQRFTADILDIYYKFAVVAKNDSDTTWQHLKLAIKSSLKSQLQTNDSNINHVFKERKLINCIQKQTFQNVMFSIMMQKLTSIECMMKITHYKLPNLVFAADGTYKLWNQTEYNKTGLWNVINQFSLGLTKFLQNSTGECHFEITDKFAYILLLTLILAEWNDNINYDDEMNIVTDRPKTDKFVPAKIIDALYGIFGWEKNDGNQHIIYSEFNGQFIDLDKIQFGELIGDLYHWIIHWEGKNMFKMKHNECDGSIARKDINYALRNCLKNPDDYIKQVADAHSNGYLFPYEAYDRYKYLLTIDDDELCDILRKIIWLNAKDLNASEKRYVATLIEDSGFKQEVMQFIFTIESCVIPSLSGSVWVKWLRFVGKIDEDWNRDSISLYDDIRIPKHTVSISIINMLRKFVQLEPVTQIYGYASFEHFKSVLLDTVEQFEKVLYWSGSESKPLWDPKNQKYAKMKQNWVHDESYLKCIFRAYKICGWGLKLTNQLEQQHGVIKRNEKQTVGFISFSKKTVDVLLGEIKYTLCHLQTLINKHQINFPNWFLGDVNILENEFLSLTDSSFFHTTSPSAIIKIEYEKTDYCKTWNKILKQDLKWKKKKEIKKKHRNNLLKTIRNMDKSKQMKRKSIMNVCKKFNQNEEFAEIEWLESGCNPYLLIILMIYIYIYIHATSMNLLLMMMRNLLLMMMRNVSICLCFVYYIQL